ncbi:erythromycin esterase family protein [Natronosalvus amylolyticus]|uniref:erythromycin esterase family protein n=1 Tax=Natronosalvus amylolyticus TaxID=2961994 RepID=UPI0020C98553|nr:erythromycin esterase family protein [Natronosalvus amylolyticus]
MTNDTPTNESTTTDHAGTCELVAQLEQSSVELATADPTANHADLAPVGDALADARIIGLGEGTHGTREFFQLKHRILRFLVEEQGLRLFTIEANLPETMALDNYVVHGEGDALEALAGTYFWVWRTEAVLALVEWLREFNAGRPLDDRVRFYGIDAQYTTGAVEHLDKFLASADPDLQEELQADFAATNDEGNTNDQYMSDHNPEATERLLDRLGTAFEERREAFLTATSERETVMARRCLHVIEQARQRRIARETDGIQASMVVRDEAMAENLSWVLEYEATDRTVLWAHDSHICRTVNFGARVEPAPSLGSHLAERYCDDYFALGFDFLSGSFSAIGIDLTPESELSTWSLDGPPADSITRVFAATGCDLAFLDFDTASENSLLDEWLAEPRAKRKLGAVYYGPDGPSENERDGQAAHNAVRVLPEAFDGLLFVRETMPSRVLEDPEH